MAPPLPVDLLASRADRPRWADRGRSVGRYARRASACTAGACG